MSLQGNSLGKVVGVECHVFGITPIGSGSISCIEEGLCRQLKWTIFQWKQRKKQPTSKDITTIQWTVVVSLELPLLFSLLVTTLNTISEKSTPEHMPILIMKSHLYNFTLTTVSPRVKIIAINDVMRIRIRMYSIRH